MEQSADGIVSEWLKSLGIGKYTTAFYDNGYDELELCKQIGEDDLNAIGVFNPLHRKILLDSVMTLRCEGATGVYFTLEDVNKRPHRQGKFTEKSAVREQIYDVSPRPKLSSCAPRVHQNEVDNGQQNLKYLSEIVSKKMSDERVDISSTPYTQQVKIRDLFRFHLLRTSPITLLYPRCKPILFLSQTSMQYLAANPSLSR